MVSLIGWFETQQVWKTCSYRFYGSLKKNTKELPKKKNTKEPRVSSNTRKNTDHIWKTKYLMIQNDNMMRQNKCCYRIIQLYRIKSQFSNLLQNLRYFKWISDDVWKWIYVMLIFLLHMDDQVRSRAELTKWRGVVLTQS